MTGKRIEVELATLGKTFAVFTLLIILSFVLGIFIGRESGGAAASPTGGAEGASEELAACTYKVQELTGKLTSLTAVAKEKGLLDPNGVLIKEVVCSIPASQQEVQPTPKEKEQTAPAVAEAKKDAPPASPTTPASPATLSGDTKPPVCKYALQIYAGRTREEALEVQSKSKVKPTRLVTGTVDGVTWYRLRYGCYPDKASAEAGVNELLQLGARAIIVKEEQP